MKRNTTRLDPIRNRHVILSSRRHRRGTDKSDGACVFCPETFKDKILTKIGNGKKWRAAVVLNKYPTVSLDNPKAYGYHRLVIDTPRHEQHFEDLSEAHIASLLKVFADQMKEFRRNSKIKYALVFKNSGPAAAASRTHAHTQLIALDFAPNMLLEESARSFAYGLGHKKGGLYQDENKREAKGPRLIGKNRYALAFCPYASEFPYEAVIRTTRHVDNLTQLTVPERRALAKLLKKVLTKLRKMDADYNFYIHDLIEDADQHVSIRIVPRLGRWGGLELASGVTVNTVLPEDAAKVYRQS